MPTHDPTDTAPQEEQQPRVERRGGARYGRPGRRSNTGLRGVSDVHRPGRAPQISVAWRGADGRRHVTCWTYQDHRDRPDVLARAVAWHAAHHVPAPIPEGAAPQGKPRARARAQARGRAGQSVPEPGADTGS